MQTICKLNADFSNAYLMQTMSTLYIRPLLSSSRLVANWAQNAIQVCIKSVYAHLVQTYVQTLCTLSIVDWKVCKMSANAHFVQTLCADFLQTWNDFLKKCASSLHMHTLCRLEAHILQTLCILLSFFQAGFRQTLFWSNANVIYIDLNLFCW